MVSNKMGTLKELGLQMPESFRELSLEDRARVRRATYERITGREANLHPQLLRSCSTIDPTILMRLPMVAGARSVTNALVIPFQIVLSSAVI